MIYKLAELLDSIRYEDLPQATIHKTKVAIQNYVGGSLPGKGEALTLAEKDMWDSFGSTGPCSVLGMSGSYSVIAAAAINAAMGEIYLSEDMHNPTSSHPGMLVIPVAMAYGESVGASGKRVIEAIVAGYEAMGRIGAALLCPDFANNGLRPASTIAPFGGAVAAMKVLGASADQIAKAMTIAGNTAAGVMEFVNAGTADICMQNCFAAKSSVMAAELARRDILASPTILEGRFGLGWGLTDGVCDWDKMFAPRPGGGHVIDETVVKAFPGGGYVQCSALAITHFLENQPIDPENVENIEIGVTHASKVWPGVDNQGPFNGTISAMMSHQYMVAAAILKGRIDVDAVRDFADPVTAELTKKIRVVEDAEIDRAYPAKSGCRIRVFLKNGQVLEHFEDHVEYLDDNGVKERLASNAAGIYPESQIQQIIQLIENFDELGSVNIFTKLLRP